MIELGDVPELHRPVVIAAFEGWNDAGEAASGAVEHLAREWDAEPVAALDPEDYYDFQVNRPTVELGDDGDRRIIWPTTRLLIARRPGQAHDGALEVILDGGLPALALLIALAVVATRRALLAHQRGCSWPLLVLSLAFMATATERGFYSAPMLFIVAAIVSAPSVA